jgi:hypothetical protein
MLGLLLSGFFCSAGGGASVGRGAVTTLCGGDAESYAAVSLSPLTTPIHIVAHAPSPRTHHHR